MPTPPLPYQRVLLKLSGEALAGQHPSGIDPLILDRITKEVIAVHALGCSLALVIGGGNIFRGGTAIGIDRTQADYMGMLATLINSLALQAELEKHQVQTRVMSALPINPVAEPYIKRRAVRHLEKGRIVLFAAGTGNPYCTTDTAASLRALEIGANVLLKATKVDGIYSFPNSVVDSPNTS